MLGVKTWLSTLEAGYLLWGMVAKWLKRCFDTWASLPHIDCVFRMRHYKPLVPSIHEVHILFGQRCLQNAQSKIV